MRYDRKWTVSICTLGGIAFLTRLKERDIQSDQGSFHYIFLPKPQISPDNK